MCLCYVFLRYDSMCGVYVSVCVWNQYVRPEACPCLCQGAETHLVFRLWKHGTSHDYTPEHCPAFVQVTTATCKSTPQYNALNTCWIYSQSGMPNTLLKPLAEHVSAHTIKKSKTKDWLWPRDAHTLFRQRKAHRANSKHTHKIDK